MEGHRMKHEECTLNIKLSFASLLIREIWIGDCLNLIVQGGEVPHIGCAVLAEPRESLKKDGTVSCTSSVLNMVGHKDEQILRQLAERAAVKYHALTVCVGGFHFDGIQMEQIEELMKAVRDVEI